MPKTHILVTCPDQVAADRWLRRLELPAGFEAQRIVVDLDTMYDDEYQFATMDIFPAVVTTTAETLEEADITQPGQWPELPAEQWSRRDAHTLVDLAVTQWGYLGHNGPDADRVLDSWRKGELQHLGRHVTIHDVLQLPHPTANNLNPDYQRSRFATDYRHRDALAKDESPDFRLERIGPWTIAWPTTDRAFAILKTAHPADISRGPHRLITDQADPFMANYLHSRNAVTADCP